MSMTPAQQRLDDAIEANKKDTNPDRTEANKRFWDAAFDAFNEDIAGTYVLADGRVNTIPPLTRH